MSGGSSDDKVKRAARGIMRNLESIRVDDIIDAAADDATHEEAREVAKQFENLYDHCDDVCYEIHELLPDDDEVTV